MDDQTRIMDEGTAIYPLDPALAQAAEACPHCTTTIPAGDQFCPNCGYQRDTWAAEAAAAVTAEGAADARFQLSDPAGNTWPLPDGESVAGRSADADLTVPDGYISRRHAVFTVAGESVTVTDLGSANGTFIGEERLATDDERALEPGGAVRLGQTELTLAVLDVPAAEDSAPEGEETMVAPAAVEESPAKDAAESSSEDISGDLTPVGMLADTASPWRLKRVGEDEVFDLPSGGSELGRKPDKCDIVVRGDGYLSGKHARIVASLDLLEVTDLGSTNGTYVNSERVAPDAVHELKAGDILRLGQTDLTVEFIEPAVGGDAGDAGDASDAEAAPVADEATPEKTTGTDEHVEADK